MLIKKAPIVSTILMDIYNRIITYAIYGLYLNYLIYKILLYFQKNILYFVQLGKKGYFCN